MGRFRDLWASGKFEIKEKAQFEEFRKQEAVDLMQELSPDALKSKRGAETGRWLSSLVPESAIQAQQPRETTGSSAFEEIISWMDKLFKQFSELTYEFNKSAVGTDLLISYEKPQVHEKKSDEVWYKPVTKTYQGRLTTRQWALVIRGRDAKISIFLLPAGMLIAFNSDQVSEEEVAPFMEVIHTPAGVWTISGETAPEETIPHLAKEILGDLIRVSSGVMSDSELFDAHDQNPTLGENLAVGFERKAPATVTPSAMAPDTSVNAEEMHVSDACDIVDGIVELELKALYEKATKILPGSPDAGDVRRQISAVETFRIKMMDAFEEFTRNTQGVKEPAKRPAPELAGQPKPGSPH